MSYPGFVYDLGTRNAVGFADGAGTPVQINTPVNFWITATATGAASATVDIVVSPDGNPANETSILETPISVSGLNSVIDFSEKVTLGGFYRFKVNAINGTNASVNVVARV